MCGFVPLRDGIADDPRRRIPLTADGAVTLLLNQEHVIDPAGLAEIFDRPRFEAWTGVRFGPMQSLEWLYPWLACVLDTSLCSMSVDQTTVDAGRVEPLFRTTTMAVPGQRELCYLTDVPPDTRRTVAQSSGGPVQWQSPLCQRGLADIR